MSKAELFRQQLEMLIAEYRGMLPGKLAEVDALWQQLAEGAQQQQACLDLLRELHTLAGSAKTFGFPELSARAREAENFFEPFCAGGAMPLPADREVFIRLLGVVRQSAAT